MSESVSVGIRIVWLWALVSKPFHPSFAKERKYRENLLVKGRMGSAGHKCVRYVS
jgi:hypothetical protein